MSLEYDLNVELIMDRLNTSVESASLSTLDAMVEDIRPYVPYNTGELDSSVVVDEESMCIVWDADYAQYAYDLPKDSNFNRDVHPNATSDWVNEARQSYEDKWIEDFKKSFSDSFGGDE